ncbi:MAG: thiamine diphosphokinase, partial [Actinobacteria bacterium]|nr:thiamine diphosphokinase [Actinomycetota bacterium]
MPAEGCVQDDTVIVIAGGETLPPRPRTPAGSRARVVAADEGVDHALALGLRVDIAVGDFDSVSPAGLAAAEAAGARIARHQAEKDATDLELALDEAVALAPRRLLVLGVDGGRLDHLLASLLGLGSDRYAELEVDALLGAASVHVVRGERRLEGEPGELISLFALHAPAEDVTTAGLAYGLSGETLRPGSSRGVSNVFAEREARISVGRGIVLVV